VLKNNEKGALILENPKKPEVTISATANFRNQNRQTIFFSDHASIIMCLGVKCGRSVELSFAVVAVPNVKVRMETQLSILSLSLRDLSRESYTFTFTFTSYSLHAAQSFLRS